MTDEMLEALILNAGAIEMTDEEIMEYITSSEGEENVW